MGKSQTNSSTDMTQRNYNRTVDQTDALRSHLLSGMGDQEKVAQGTYNTTRDAYTSFLGGTGGYDPEAYAKVSANNEKNQQTGGYNAEALASLRNRTAGNAQSGGYTADELARLNNGIGGMDEGQVGVVRGAYGDLIKTGGLSDTAADAMRRQAAGTTQSIYATLGSKLARAQSIAGAGGAGGETAQMARQAAQAGAVATTGANAEIGKIRQSGIVAGTGGLANFETGVGAGNRAGIQAVAEGRLKGTDQELNLESNVAKGTLQASQANQDLASGAAQQRIQAAGGLVNLYNASPGYVTDMVKSIIDVQNSGGQLNNQQAQIMQELSKNPGLFDNIMKGITTVGGAVTGVMTGIGSLPSSPKGGK